MWEGDAPFSIFLRIATGTEMVKGRSKSKVVLSLSNMLVQVNEQISELELGS